MSFYNDALDMMCQNLEDRYNATDSKYAVHCIAFAGARMIGDAPSMSMLRGISGETCIPQAFDRAVLVARKMRATLKFESVTLLFISDGEDNDMLTCAMRLQQLPGMPCPCRFLCVGCNGFPTKLASGKLFELFGTANNVCEPPVLPCPSSQDVPEVFAEVYRLLDTPDASPAPTMDDIQGLVTVEQLLQGAKRAYNACVMKSMYFRDTPECDAFQNCKDILAWVRAELQKQTRDFKSMGVGLLSHCGSVKATLVVEDLQQKVNECLAIVSHGRRVAELDDRAKLAVVGMAGRVGTVLANKALKYHAIDTARIKQSFVKFLEDYPDSPAAVPRDASVRIAPTTPSLYDVCADAKSVLSFVRSGDFTVYDMAELFPHLGYAVELKKLLPGAVMNCWLLEVTHVSLYNFTSAEALRESAGALQAQIVDPCLPSVVLRNPTETKCLLMVPSEKAGEDTSYLKYISSYLLYDGEPIYHNEASMALMAACAVNFLQNRTSDCTKGLDIVYSALNTVYPKRPSFYDNYFAAMQSPERFRECLVRQADSLDKGLKCPHLTKFVFTVWLVGKECRPWTEPELHARRMALTTEMLYRAGANLTWLPVEYKRPVKLHVPAELSTSVELAHPLWFGVSKKQALNKALPVLLKPFQAYKKNLGEIFMPSGLDIADIATTGVHMQFDLKSICEMFVGLAGMSGLPPSSVRELSEREIAKCLSVASVMDDLKRNAAPSFDVAMTEAEFNAACYKPAYGAWMAKVTEEVSVFFLDAYKEAMKKAHEGPVTRLDPEHVKTWSAKYGIPAADVLDVDKVGLSRTTCLCQTCPYYMKPMGSSNRKSRVSPVLKAHLEDLEQLPGLHKVLFDKCPIAPGEALDAYVARVATIVQSGHLLDLEHPESEAINREIDSLAERMNKLNPRIWGFDDQKTYIATSVERLERKLNSYGKQAKGKIHFKYHESAHVDAAIRSVLRVPMLDEQATHALLSAYSKYFFYQC